MTQTASLSSDPEIDALLWQARELARTAAGEAAAMDACLQAVRLDPSDLVALVDLAGLALRRGYRQAARSAYAQAVDWHPYHAPARLALGDLMMESSEFEAARGQFQAALDAAPGLSQAHQGLARALSALGDAAAAAPHWSAGFIGHAVSAQPYLGEGQGIRLLLLVSAKGGNIPTRTLLDDRIFAVTAVYADYHQPDEPVPPHDLIFNAIGDADLCADALAGAGRLIAASPAPAINPPALVAATGRAACAARLAALEDVVAPTIRQLSRAALSAAEDLAFPLLVRSPGYQTGEHFVRVESQTGLAAAIAGLPGDELLAIDYLDAGGPGGLARKYRVMFIGGELYPVHLAISEDWKVHYFTSSMADRPDRRAEEAAFLADMPAVLGSRAVAGLRQIGVALGLDYAGVDFAVAADGRVLLFEANAAMVLQPPGPEPIWDYRRAAIQRALDAVRVMLLAAAS